MATELPNVRTLVVKIGTTLLSGESGFDGRVLEPLVKDLAALKRDRELNLLIVSSGAIGCGMNLLGMDSRPVLLPLKQATAAVGQARLMHIYEVLFQTYGDGLKTAQVLLAARDLDERRSYLNVRNTIYTLFQLDVVVPIVNENDSIAPDELRFGDNDTLAARVASKIGADLLIVLSNVDGLYDRDPASHADARLIEQVETVTDEIEALAEDTRQATSIGGMKTKLAAARIACSSGVPMIIANGNRAHAVSDALAGRGPMTRFGVSPTAMTHRKRWIAFGRAPKGAVRIDDGARDALLTKGRSLLAAGITAVEGDFDVGEAVSVKDSTGRDVARGLINYSYSEVDAIKGRKSAEIAGVLGYKDFDEVIHRDNLVVL